VKDLHHVLAEEFAAELESLANRRRGLPAHFSTTHL